jgi:hypothetical protein
MTTKTSKPPKTALVIVIFAVISLACNLSGATPNLEGTALALQGTQQAMDLQSSMATTSAQVAATVVPVNTPIPTEAPPPILGDEYRNEDGGYAFRTIPAYSVDGSFDGSSNMVAPNADPEIGPMVMFNVDDFDAGSTIDQRFEELKRVLAEGTQVQYTNNREVTVGGQRGLAADLSESVGGEAFIGRIVLVNMYPSLDLFIWGVAPSAQWDELNPRFDAVLASTTFFQPQAIEPLAPPTSLGQEHRNEDGGFAFRTIPTYSVESYSGGSSYMEAPNADPDFGPMIVLEVQIADAGSTTDQDFEELKRELAEGTQLQYTNNREVTVGGLRGLATDLSGSADGEAIGGRIVLVKVKPTRIFIMLGAAPSAQWGELDPRFEAVLATITFFDIKEDEPLCGNGICGDFENPGNCPQDCSSSPEPLCGNGICGDFENPGNCPQDCSSSPEPLCGNGVCGDFENPGNCPQDCSSSPEPLCGNGVCGDFENPGNCPQDCN